MIVIDSALQVAFVRYAAWRSQLPPFDFSRSIWWIAHRNSPSLKFQDLSGTQWIQANINEVNLRGANLKGARFDEARMYGAQLQNADLTNSDFMLAQLAAANLRGASYEGPILPRHLLTMLICAGRIYETLNLRLLRCGVRILEAPIWREHISKTANIMRRLNGHLVSIR